MWPFKKKSKKVNEVKKSPSNLVNIPSLNFIGRGVESPNGHFLVAWTSSALKHHEELCSYVLVSNNKVLCSGKLKHPKHGKVADNGTFILVDALLEEGLKSVFYAFSQKGTEIICHRFSALVSCIGLSPNGHYAVARLSSSGSEDGSRLAFFNLVEKKLLWKLQPEVWPESFLFNDKTKRLGLIDCRGHGVYEYSYDGIFIDSERWEKERVKPITCFDFIGIAQQKLNKNSSAKLKPEIANEVINLLNQALEKNNMDSWPYEQAKVYRTMGEVYETLGNVHLAIKSYESAIASNPKIGIKRRLEKLRNTS